MPASRFGRTLAAALLAAALASCDRLGGDHVRWAPDSVTVALPAPAGGGDPQARWKPFLADMAVQTGLKVKAVFIRSDDDEAAAFRRGDVQAGWFSAPVALDAVRHAKGEVAAAPTLAAESDGDAAVLLVRAASPITIDQLLKCGRRLSFAEGPPRSVAGVLAPTAQLFAPKAATPESCFRVVRAGGLKANALAVASGGLDAAVSDTDTLRALGTERPAAASQVKAIWTSRPLPGDVVVLRKDLDPSLREKLRAFLVSYGHATGAAGDRQRKVLAALGYSEMGEADNDDLVLPFREMEAAMRLRAARNSGDQKAQRQAEAELARVVREEAAND